MKKIVLIMSLLCILVLAGCQSKIVSNDVTGNVVGIIEYGAAKEERMGAEKVTVKEFNIVASSSAYEPKIMQVSNGDYIRLILYAKDHNYGFVLPAYGINEYLEEDNYKTIEFVADQSGTFTFFSNVYSGPNTKDMNGKLIVAEVE